MFFNPILPILWYILMNSIYFAWSFFSTFVMYSTSLSHTCIVFFLFFFLFCNCLIPQHGQPPDVPPPSGEDTRPLAARREGFVRIFSLFFSFFFLFLHVCDTDVFLLVSISLVQEAQQSCLSQSPVHTSAHI